MIQNSIRTYDAFCDTSFLLYYYFAFYKMHETNRDNPDSISFPPRFFPHLKKINKTIPIAEKMFSHENTISLAYNHGILFELVEKISENNLREKVAAHIPLLLVQNRGKKDYSALAKWLIADCKRLDAYPDKKISPLQQLVYNCFESTEYEFLETGLWGIDLVPYFLEQDMTYRLNSLAYFSKCQIGFADIHHLLSAESLGCKYFFTYDSDYELMKEEIKDVFGLSVITKPEEILWTISPNKKLS